MQIQQYHKTRIAPTPSGYLHLGNILSFAVTAALAKQHHADLLLRIDDMDKARANNAYLEDIFKTLEFLAIPWQEGARNVLDFEQNYSQIHRMRLYNDALNQLRDNNAVFACSCSRAQMITPGYLCTCMNKQIPLATIDAAWRLKTSDREIQVKDYTGKVMNAYLPNEMTNFVVKKKDSFPAYQLTSVIDDLHFGIDLIVRGKDLWASTLAQQQLASVLGLNGFAGITFFHHPLITAASGIKLSKSAGATSIRFLRSEGRSAAEIYALAAQMAGFREKIDNWEQLGNAILI